MYGCRYPQADREEQTSVRGFLMSCLQQAVSRVKLELTILELSVFPGVVCSMYMDTNNACPPTPTHIYICTHTHTLTHSLSSYLVPLFKVVLTGRLKIIATVVVSRF